MRATPIKPKKKAVWPEGMRVEGAELPPAERTCKGKSGPSRSTRERLAFLQANAGKWCRLIECDSTEHVEHRRMLSLGTLWRQNGNYPGCEFAVRTTGGKRVLFGRYVPSVEG